MVRPAGETEPLLRRPFAVYRRTRSAAQILFQVVGRGTARLARLRPGDRLDVLGPLGRPFTLGPRDRLHVYAAGGIGAASLLWPALEARARGRAVVLLYGARTRSALVCRADFRRAGIPVRPATDDGSAGHHGPVTDLLDRLAPCPEPSLFACGPWAMLRRTQEAAARHGWDGIASLEAHMGCGIGTCLGCTVEVRGPEGIEHRRVCTEGPLFRLSEVVWT